LLNTVAEFFSRNTYVHLLPGWSGEVKLDEAFHLLSELSNASVALVVVDLATGLLLGSQVGILRVSLDGADGQDAVVCLAAVQIIKLRDQGVGSLREGIAAQDEFGLASLLFGFLVRGSVLVLKSADLAGAGLATGLFTSHELGLEFVGFLSRCWPVIVAREGEGYGQSALLWVGINHGLSVGGGQRG